uniref:Ankyrin repeat-containing protein n=1 Tax=Candidatus Kentrum sp. FW TaxID=2126338 RepID=A0A450U2L7_9GAMM|nr:MAG: hypothetical protein BECKFW1821C_GA0114237_11206 [Candidatus Kentron sp. FW]
MTIELVLLGITVGIGVVSIILAIFAIWLSWRFARDSRESLAHNLRLFQAVFDNDVDTLKTAIDDGADVNITDTALIKRHLKELTNPPVLERLGLQVVSTLLKQNLFVSKRDRDGKEAELAHAS